MKAYRVTTNEESEYDTERADIERERKELVKDEVAELAELSPQAKS